MRYFLKKTNRPKGEYLQIYQSEYIRGVGSRNRSYKAIGYVDELIARGTKDPVAKAQAEVKRLNDELKAKEDGEKARKIGKSSPQRFLGYFVLKAVANSLGDFEKAVRAISSVRGFQYDVYELMMALVYARATFPASKRRTHSDILPLLFEKIDDDSYSQVLSCCEYIGSEYLKIIALLTRAVERTYGLDCHETYFDCTNFYFEIDKEDDFRRNGPSKENRKDPIVGMGLLLDANQIPVAMEMFPGNEAEMPYLRKTIQRMKKESSISGRTIQVADKGLNCAANIHAAIESGDGYLFSKSLKKQSQKEIEWFLSLDSDGWDAVYESDGKGGKQVKYRYYSFIDTFDYSYTDGNGSLIGFKAREKRIITFNPKLRMKKILELNRMVEKARGLCLSQAKKDEFGECSKFVSFCTDEGEKAKAVLNEEAIELERRFAGYNMLVTSELKLNDRTVYGIYHNLWRIEQSFRMMKSYLDARPVYLTGMNSIKGHFLICYISVVLERLLEFKVLGSRFSHEKIMDFIRSFSLVRLNSKDYVNLLTSDDEVGQFLADTILPEVTNYILSPADVSKLLKLRLKRRIDDC